ncbi:MAG: hypothetical protein H7Y04_07715 [Verrucomicrobia bacterium]|nr:hypothetical protein [Cytophagales bacterium]
MKDYQIVKKNACSTLSFRLKALISMLPALVFCLFVQAVSAQTSKKYLPEFKPGLKVEYEVSYLQIDGTPGFSPMVLTLATLNEKEMIWDAITTFNDSINVKMQLINSRVALREGTEMDWGSPNPGEIRRLGDKKTVAFFSGNFVKDLKTKNTATYDGIVYKLVPTTTKNAFSAGGKAWDALHFVSADAKTRYWILNSTDYPLVLKVEGNTKGGPNLLLQKITP